MGRTKKHNLVDLVDSDGVRICADRCPTCIFRPGNLHLNEGRVKDMVSQATQGDAGSIVCHATLDLRNNAICRGFWDSYRDRVQLLQFAERIGFTKFVDVEPTP